MFHNRDQVKDVQMLKVPITKGSGRNEAIFQNLTDHFNYLVAFGRQSRLCLLLSLFLIKLDPSSEKFGEKSADFLATGIKSWLWCCCRRLESSLVLLEVRLENGLDQPQRDNGGGRCRTRPKYRETPMVMASNVGQVVFRHNDYC